VPESGGPCALLTAVLAQGGAKNCALCSGVQGGALPCDKVTKSTNSWSSTYSTCPDDKIMSNRKWVVQWSSSGVTGGTCNSLDSDISLASIAVTTYKFPAPGSSLVLTKAFVTHPNNAHKRVGVVMFKRLVTHTCTRSTSACKKGTTVADVFKVGVCVKCDYDVYPSTLAKRATDEHRKSFVNTCLPKAIDAKGAVKAGFRCTGGDKTYADASVAGF
jgi:hypothetical protein